eukprot:TRINITY_DN5551_c0_g1_i1.p1 TRINITY_DN5551_c0_g1~~TRINITY_DN5551_c0_g1_i1.p1  ORF type:complete len:645 (-),score=122.45 TRINITY_DN5551_c0_g1_i1:1379-3313(-)
MTLCDMAYNRDTNDTKIVVDMVHRSGKEISTMPKLKLIINFGTYYPNTEILSDATLVRDGIIKSIHQLKLSDLKHVLNNLNIKKDKSSLFNACQGESDDNIDHNKIRRIFRRLGLYNRHNADYIIDLYGGSGYLTGPQFNDFLEMHQHEVPLAEGELRELFTRFNPEGESEIFSQLGLELYLSSSLNSIENPQSKTIHMDMTHPFPHYFINSSHNTYLLGNQLNSQSNIYAYKYTLLKGCRCVELDIWNGENGKEPVIFHGNTLTSKISFRSVLQVIREYAFYVSDYPVILSFENHCDFNQQATLARIIEEELRDYGLLPPTAPIPEDATPEDLRGFILIKGKVNENSDEPEDQEGPPPALNPILCNYIHVPSQKFMDYDWHRENGKSYHITSLCEKENSNEKLNDGALFVEMNKNVTTRIYPHGLRVDSSNYNPVPFWYGGSQLVALNYQTCEIPMWLNDGKFRVNGGCGYVLKPEIMICDNIEFDGPYGHSYPLTYKNLSIKIISGWRIQRSSGNSDCKVTVSVFSKNKPNPIRTTRIESNLHKPIWNETVDLTYCNEDLDILMFQVQNKNPSITKMARGQTVGEDFTIAYYSLPIAYLREGYRVINLFAVDGSPTTGELFVHVEKKGDSGQPWTTVVEQYD